MKPSLAKAVVETAADVIGGGGYGGKVFSTLTGPTLSLLRRAMMHFWRQKKKTAATSIVLAAVIRTAFVIVFLSEDEFDGGDRFDDGERSGGGTGESEEMGKKVSIF